MADTALQDEAKQVARRVARRVRRTLDTTTDERADAPSGDALPKLLFVLGSQRSGTNALRRSISLDPWVMGFNERADDRWYDDWQLRPEPELRPHLRALPSRTVLFKPIVNMQHQPLTTWLEQWRDYESQVAWIYRDPVDVFQSRAKHWDDKGDLDDFLDEWHRVNRPVVSAMDDDGRISLVRYEDLANDNTVVWSLFRRLGVHGENLFRAGPSKGRARLSPDVVAAVEEGTAELLAELDRRRTFVPTPVEDVADGEASGGDA